MKVSVMEHFCNCKVGQPSKLTSKFRAVKVDDNGLCWYCGHTTLCTDKPAYRVVLNTARAVDKGYSSDWLDNSVDCGILDEMRQ